MSVPEWVAIIVITVICGVIGWGVARLVKAIDDASASLKEIDERLGEIAVSQGKGIMWMDAHDKQDDERYHDMKTSIDALWSSVSHLRT